MLRFPVRLVIHRCSASLRRSATIGLLAFTSLLCGFSLRATADEQAPEASPNDEQRYESFILQQPGLVRYYTFEGVTLENAVADDLAGSEHALEYGGPDPLVVVTGRSAERTAVQLDHNWFEGQPVDVDRSSSVSLWFRTVGPGNELGNGSTSGMLVAQGDGYWSGLRVYVRYPRRDVHFQIGRPQPAHAVGLTGDEPVVDGAWHHLVATWDGNRMRLYLNGLLIDCIDYEGVYSKPSGRLRVGYANAGIGSVKLQVDELAIFDRALSAGEVLQMASATAATSRATEAWLRAHSATVGAEDWKTVERLTKQAGEKAELPESFRSRTQWALARSMWKQGRTPEAVADYTRVFENPDTPQAIRDIAAYRCMTFQRDVFSAKSSEAVYRRLLQRDDLTAEQRAGLHLALGECLLRGDDPAAAEAQFDSALATGVIQGQRAWDVRLQRAHARLAASQFAEARAAYAAFAAMPDCPIEFRGNARLCVGHAWFLDKQYGQAAKAFTEVAESADLLDHHRWEARQRANEMERMAAGLPARDTMASRTSIPQPPEPGVVLFVAPAGNDTDPGTAEQPLATLAGARDRIRAIKSDGGLPPGGVCVFVRDGTYSVRETIAFDEHDSGTAESPIIYQADEGAKPRFTGGVELSGLTAVTDPKVLARLPEAARDRVRQLNLKEKGVTDFGQIEQRGYGFAGYPANAWVDVYLGGHPLELARWPNDGFIEIDEVFAGQFRSDDSARPGVFGIDEERPRRWDGGDDIWMFGYWGHLWAGRSVRVASLDAENGRITTAQRSTYGYRQGAPFYFFNVFEELDCPGEYYLDRDSGMLYLIPPEGAAEATVHFPILAAPLVQMDDASHITLRGLTFELARTEGLVMRGGQKNLVAGCTFGRLGTNGLIVQGGTGHGALGCDLHTLGAGGVRMSGGDRATLKPGRHFVENCHVRDFSRIDRAYAPAVHLDGVGNRIAHNLFHDSPHHAMRVEGYEHLVELNEIHSVVYEADDQAGIDIYGNPAYRGLVIRWNYWHHIGSGHNVAGQAGIRLDDFISRVLMYGNVFYRSADGRFGAIQIHGGKDNLADNNLFIDCRSAFSFSPWGQKRWESRLEEPRTQHVVSAYGVDINKPPHSTRYPDLANMRPNADRNFLWRNVAIDCGRFHMRERGVNELMDNISWADESCIAGHGSDRPRLKPDSPVYRRLGFRPIPFEEIGLYEDANRATWPVEHRPRVAD